MPVAVVTAGVTGGDAVVGCAGGGATLPVNGTKGGGFPRPVGVAATVLVVVVLVVGGAIVPIFAESVVDGAAVSAAGGAGGCDEDCVVGCGDDDFTAYAMPAIASTAPRPIATNRIGDGFDDGAATGYGPGAGGGALTSERCCDDCADGGSDAGSIIGNVD